MKGMSISDEQVKQLNQSVKVMFFIFTAHTLLTFYSAFYMSNEAWAFISGGLFYILFGLYFVFEIIKNKYFKKGQKIEWLPIVNEKGEIKGKATREQCHQNKELMHPVVHVHIFNKSKQLYLQKRPENKKIQPGKWDTAVGGHISFGEKIEEGLTREIKEELNITDIDPKLAAKYIWESNVEKELVFMFLASYDKEIKHNTEELEGGKFWTLNNINNNLNKGIFTPNFEKEYHILKKTILKK